MVSTWKAVRDELYEAIVAKWSELGFASEDDANVRKVFPELVGSDHLADYFWASLAGGEQAIRAWAVSVANPVPDYDRMPEATASILLNIRVGAWYELGDETEAALETLQEHLSVVIEAFHQLGVTLGDTVLRIVSWNAPTVSKVGLEVAGYEGEVLYAEFTIVADEPNGTI